MAHDAPNNLPVELKVRVTQIPEAGLTLEALLSPDFLLVDESDRMICREPVAVNGLIKLVGSSLLVTGTVKTVIHCFCDRCLCEYEQSVVADELCVYFDDFDEKIDLTDAIREDILIAFPQNTLCDPKCEGLCVQCGANLNTTSCDCEAPILDDDTETSGESVWGALDQLNLD